MDRNGDLRQQRVWQQPPGLQQLLPPQPYTLGVWFGAWQAGTPASPLGCWAVGWAALVLSARKGGHRVPLDGWAGRSCIPALVLRLQGLLLASGFRPGWRCAVRLWD